MKSKLLLTSVLVLALCSRGTGAPDQVSAPHRFAIGDEAFLLDGQPFQIRCGEIHAARVPREYWLHRLQMLRAMGLNTVCAYLFWNVHEPEPGRYDWSGRADAAEFCRLAQQAGLWVILRPGPYSCAEWEMGGLPWWLLRDHDIQLRTTDPRFIAPARRYLKEVGRVLAPLQITRGGPIIMVQAENEYGSYGNSAEYMGEIRQGLLDGGFDVPLFACNGPEQMRRGWRPDLFPVVNFGDDPTGSFRTLREVLPRGPLMCGEFYPGWFDTWGVSHHTGQTDQYIADMGQMLAMKASFSIYVAHGGTTFGLWAGADRPFKPDVSSYDYDAPVTEAGWTTDKYYRTRELMMKYLAPGEVLPAVPAPNPTMEFAPIQLTRGASLMANLPEARFDERPRTMEEYNQGFGTILYRTVVPAGPEARLEMAAVHDFGFVFLDGVRIDVADRRSTKYAVTLPARTSPSTLDILVEPMGRVNYGPEMHDPKGLIAPVKLQLPGAASTELTGWQVFSLPLDGAMLGRLVDGPLHPGQPVFWRGSFTLAQAADTFLDLSDCGKGVVWVNGHCLARYWNIGPTQSAYAPGPWLRAGENEIVILDYLGAHPPVVRGMKTPILAQLRLGLDFTRRTRPVVKVELQPQDLAAEGNLAPGSDAKEVKLGHAAKGRYLALQLLSAHDGGTEAALAEVTPFDAHGRPVSLSGAKIAAVDSEETLARDGTAENAIDSQAANVWHSAAGAPYPHLLVIDLGAESEVAGVRLLPPQGAESASGRVKAYRLYVLTHLDPAKATQLPPH